MSSKPSSLTLSDFFTHALDVAFFTTTFSDVVLSSTPESDTLFENVAEALKGMAGVMIGPGFGQRCIDGKFVAIKYTRTHDIPTFGICLGMQCIAIEFARNVLGYADANSREMDDTPPHNVSDLMDGQKAITNMGGPSRLGA